MPQVLDKRLADSRVYSINCTPLLLNGATIASASPVTADQGGLVFGSPTINSEPVTFDNGTTADTACAIQVNISEGAIPTGLPLLICTVRAVFLTTAGETLEATVLLRLVNTPGI